MQTTKIGIRAWNNTADRTCYRCGKVLGDHYIRVNNYYFCQIRQETDGFSADCFSAWAVDKFPSRIARRMIVEIPTPDMKP